MPKNTTPWAAIATAVRREVRTRREELGIPDGVTVRVSSDSFAGGASVDVTLSGADTWAFRAATADDDVVRQGYYKAGDTILADDVRPVGEAVAEIIRAARDAADVGYVWGGVTYDGLIIGSVARQGFVPGED